MQSIHLKDNLLSIFDAANIMQQIYEELVDETGHDFFIRKFVSISEYGTVRFAAENLFLWENEDGEFAFIDYHCYVAGVYSKGNTHHVSIKQSEIKSTFDSTFNSDGFVYKQHHGAMCVYDEEENRK